MADFDVVVLGDELERARETIEQLVVELTPR